MKQFIFVYNADSGLFNSLTDFAHKIMSPSTYSCQLCALTYGNLIVKKEWQTFIRQLPFEVVFMYKDEWVKKQQIITDFPVLFMKDDFLQPLISAAEINACHTLPGLEKLITHKLAIYDQHHHTGL